MAASEVISCKQYKNFLVSQEPVYDKEILRDVRPMGGDLLGYYQTGAFDAYSGVQHTYDRFNHVFPNVTQPWNDVQSGNCVGTPCDPSENKVGWGYTRGTYSLVQQSWATDVLCFDDLMTKTRAKEHFSQIIGDILRPATTWIMTYFLMRKAMELAGKAWCANATMADTTFTWDSGGYIYLTTTADPTSRLTPNMLQSRVKPQYAQGAIDKSKDSYRNLELHTDEDTFRYLCQEDSTLKNLWRFGQFDAAAKEFYKYGLSGFVGDFMVKCLTFPLRFNKVAANRYQLVLPYTNSAADEGLKSEFNEDYQKAQYQISYINHRRGLRILPFRPQAINREMPFLVRDYGGRWRFATNDLGADCNGKPIDNTRGNKGKFFADFRLAVKPEHEEWIEAIFHKVDYPCITVVATCNDDPGYPTQTYDSENSTCPTVMVFTSVEQSGGGFSIQANSITCDGNVITHGAVTGATLALLVVDLQAKWTAAGQDGTWTVYDSSANEIKLAYTAGDTMCGTIDIPFDL